MKNKRVVIENKPESNDDWMKALPGYEKEVEISEGFAIYYEAKKNRVVARGGKGSGHFGHAGRPGEQGGSLPSGGGADLTIPFSWPPEKGALRILFPKETIRALQRFHYKYADEYAEREHLMIIDKEGRISVEMAGSKTSVSASLEELHTLYKGTMIHNHPNDSMFSRADLATFLLNQGEMSFVLTENYLFASWVDEAKPRNSILTANKVETLWKEQIHKLVGQGMENTLETRILAAHFAHKEMSRQNPWYHYEVFDINEL